MKSPRKNRSFWNDVKENKERGMGALEEHHLDASSPRNQVIRKKLVFMGMDIAQESGVLMIIERDLEPMVVFNQPFDQVIGICIRWENKFISIFNVYAPNAAKEQAKLWKELTKTQIEGKWCLLGDFNMVEKKRDSLNSCKFGKESQILMGRRAKIK